MRARSAPAEPDCLLPATLIVAARANCSCFMLKPSPSRLPISTLDIYLISILPIHAALPRCEEQTGSEQRSLIVKSLEAGSVQVPVNTPPAPLP